VDSSESSEERETIGEKQNVLTPTKPEALDQKNVAIAAAEN
jgi:hypothetical protein